MPEAQINHLPDPDLFRDAVFLAKYGRWSPAELEDTDAELLALVRRLQRPAKRTT